ncbi:sigma-54 interaction domain-containing protein [Novilysobacter arseniciresistens]|uniref:sigma-54 interaction domain-containing protein n=1 Tax=Novilysobacter arseniciresistens TaxID=1385522 RepID=UPI0006903660|nr:sigma-54 dependent transcriptional regulator [Lysobacter arseniciresistens]
MDNDAPDPRDADAQDDDTTPGLYDDSPDTGPRVATGMVGDCPAIRGLQQDLARVATTPASVLVTGESGTGKELVAHAVHVMSGRPGRFVAVNCGAIAPDLLASHLFGHERGSFTGAAARHVGYFEQANRGTLFLDEITEMPAALQVYLLRALETGTITRVGGTTAVEFDTRIVAATNRDPARAIDEGLLREDLFYRLADFIVELPPLRVRGDDALLLAGHFLAALNEEHGTNKRLADDAAGAIMAYDWPGNVRELRSVVQRAFILGTGDVVDIGNPAHPALRRRAGDDDAETVVFTVGMSYAEVQQEMLRKTLEYYDNDKARAARMLGVSVRTIHNQLARERRGARRAAPGQDGYGQGRDDDGEAAQATRSPRNDDGMRMLSV